MSESSFFASLMSLDSPSGPAGLALMPSAYVFAQFPLHLIEATFTRYLILLLSINVVDIFGVKDRTCIIVMKGATFNIPRWNLWLNKAIKIELQILSLGKLSTSMRSDKLRASFLEQISASLCYAHWLRS